MAAAAATISDGLEIVLYWSPAMISCSAAIVASLPVTGGTGSTPAALKAAMAPPPVPSLAATTPRMFVAEAGDLAARPFLRLRRRPVRRVELGQRRVAAVVEPGVDAVPDQAGGRVGRRAVDLQDARALGGGDARRLQMLRPAMSAIALPMPSLSKET